MAQRQSQPQKQNPKQQKQIQKVLADFPFGKENYIIMIIGIVVIFLGFLLMSGGGSADPNVYNPDIFSARRITLAPIVVVLGFIIEIYAIMKKPKD